MDHHFNVSVAKELGIAPAIILEHFRYFILNNKKERKNYRNGKYWTFNSIKGLCDFFPYFTKDQVTYAIQKLVDFGVVEKGSFNNKGFDRTTWYTITEKGFNLLHDNRYEISDEENPDAIVENAEATNNSGQSADVKQSAGEKKSAGNKAFKKPTVEEVREYVSSKNYHISAEAFVDYYEARGWKYGQGKPMVDWKAAVRNWEHRNKERANSDKGDDRMPEYRDSDFQIAWRAEQARRMENGLPTDADGFDELYNLPDWRD